MTNMYSSLKTSGHRWIYRPTPNLSVCENVGHKHRPRILWAVTSHMLYHITTIIWVTICRWCLSVLLAYGTGFQKHTRCTKNVCSIQYMSLTQRDSKRWTQFRTSIFPELYMIRE